MSLPRLALAVRQPWAWALIHAGKDVENRSWVRWKKDWKWRGRVAILASAGMKRDEYLDAQAFMRSLDVDCPSPDALVRGAVIGSVQILSNVWASPSPWFVGPGALVLTEPEPALPVPAKGQLGFFEWHPTDGGEFAPPAKWMLPKPEVML